MAIFTQEYGFKNVSCRTLLAAKRLFVGSYICWSLGGLSANEKEGKNASKDKIFALKLLKNRV